MAFKMPELKRARDIIVEKCGLPSGDAARVIGLFNTGGASGVPDYQTISNILAGDVSAVPGACAALDINTGSAPAGSVKDPGEAAPTDTKTGDGSSVTAGLVKDIKPGEATPGASTGQKTTKNKAKNKNIPVKQKDTAPVEGVHAVREPKKDIIPSAPGEVVQDDELPPGFGDRCCEWVEAFCDKHGIDSNHIKSQQWRSACMYVGENIKHTGVYRDRERERHEGGVIYSGPKLEKLLALWAYLCGSYNQVPLVSDFINFSGVSRGFFYDYDGRGLSSTSVQLVQKARKIEEAGLGSAVVSGGGAAVGSMFLLKARHNYSETVTIQHTSSTTALGVSDLPLLQDLSNKKA